MSQTIIVKLFAKHIYKPELLKPTLDDDFSALVEDGWKTIDQNQCHHKVQMMPGLLHCTLQTQFTL